MRILTAKDEATGEYKIPQIIYSDAYSSEMVAYADLILPDTTYLERWDCISLLDRPISSADGPADAIRQPVVAARPRRAAVPERADRHRRAARSCRASSPKPARRNIPAAIRTTSSITSAAPGVGSLAGFRGADGTELRQGRAQPEPARSLHRQRLLPRASTSPPEQRYYKHANKAYLEWAKALGFIGTADADRVPALPRAAAEIPPGGARPRRGAAAASASRRDREIFRSDPVLVSAVRGRTGRHEAFPLQRSPSGRCTCTTRGARTTAGSARSRRRTASTCNRARAREARHRRRRLGLDQSRARPRQGPRSS